MSNSPIISIIIPVYNVEHYIEECIDSIKKQSFMHFEAIIVDDGSKDSSMQKCLRLIGDDSRFHVFHKENGGLMSAWKYGLMHASGEYIGFVDSDDWIDSNMYEVLYDAIEKYKADVVVSGYIAEGYTSRLKYSRDKLYVFEGEAIECQFLKDYCCSYFKSVSSPSICRWDKLYRKSILLNNIDFFNEKVSLAEDFNANIPVILDANKIVLLPNFTPYHYRYNPKSIVNTINPKAFFNIAELVKAWNKISHSKSYNNVYVDSFIGNLLFEEVNRICKSISFVDLNASDIDRKISLCNGYFYLNSYALVRSTIRIHIFNWFIQHKYFKIIKILVFLNSYR